MINLVIPMAGKGQRFRDAGYKDPKPFINVAGKMMIERVLDNLALECNHQTTLIAQKKFLSEHPKKIEFIESEYNCKFFLIDEHTNGTACTLLLAQERYATEEPLLIANCDQIVETNINDFVLGALSGKADGSIMTFIEESMDNKWSYVKTDQNDFITEAKEKKAISNHATVGIYLFSSGNHFIKSAKEMIEKEDSVNGEFYTCPIYNYYLREKPRITEHIIKREQMHGIGTPEDLEHYLNKLG